MLLQLGYKASTVPQNAPEESKVYSGGVPVLCDVIVSSPLAHRTSSLSGTPPMLRHKHTLPYCFVPQLLRFAPLPPARSRFIRAAQRYLGLRIKLAPCPESPKYSHKNFDLRPNRLPTPKGLLHLSPDVYQEMEASRKLGGGAPCPGSNGGGSVNYMTSKDMGPCSSPLPPGHPPYYSGSGSGSPSPTATMARELLLNGQSPTGDASLTMMGKNMALPCGVSVQPAQQLDYLARIQGFQVFNVHFSVINTQL
ncbi:Double-stranded RNA-binding protein Staufen 2 [Liparis tanakae]|uniref:Double-stranded RNA-binding protein Staufen 2 n=1 Tax=Liparis tanakae TaxID=230148 RepID=A0A4Z2JFP1_9TELE|nr:Double-stranded RNA-binding protein Staufen 2 [Liparis tanakae]